MKTRIRREREFQQREVEFLDLARRMIADGGLHAFNMDRLAEATEYSKGTIYQHFASKEDLLTALAIQSLERRAAWFHRAIQFPGRTREKLYAVTLAEEIFVTLQPLHFRSEMMIKFADFRERASPERTLELDRLEDRCLADVREVMDEAVRVGDLVIPPSRTLGDLLVGFCSLHIGTFLVMNHFPEVLRGAGVTNPLRVLREQVALMMDGLGWRPLSTDADPAASFRRILHEVFPDESRQAKLLV